MELRRVFAVVLLLGLLAPAAWAKTYEVDPAHSNIVFSIKHFVSYVEGRFRDFSGSIDYDPNNPAASAVSFTVQARSIYTDNDKRDTHLRSEDFFDVDKHPTLTFKSKKVIARDKEHLDVVGEITIRGVTRGITVPITILGTTQGFQGELIGFRTEFTINRKDFGIVWNRSLDKGGSVLGDEVQVRILVEAGAKS
ncbi:MAG: YceI family protein [Candidatus Eremiobacterota bacterium]